MIDLVVFSVTAGVLAGSLFYGGLWWTVQQVNRVKHPALLILASTGVRTLLTMTIFYGVMSVTGSLLYLGIGLVSFIIVRIVMSHQLRPKNTGERHATES